MICRLAREDEREALKLLWRDSFGDEGGFLDWFFAERFLPDYCAIVEQDGLIAACAHSLPLFVRVRDAVLPGAVLAGVATRPEYRKRGMMRAAMGFLMNELRSRGVVVTPHRPERLGTFFGIGHYPVCDMQYVHRRTGYRPAAAAPEIFTAAAPPDGLYLCYQRFSLRYSGIISRSYADFRLKLRDYASCGGRVLMHRGVDGADGYLMFFDDGDRLFGDECVALEEGVYQELFDGLCAAYPDREITLRMPPDVAAPVGAERESMPRAVLGCCNIQALLQAAGTPGATLEVYDSVVPGNNGRFFSDGGVSRAEPDISIEAGRLTQWAVGYMSMAELAAQGLAEVHSPDAAERMDAAGKRACYIIDEY